MKPKLHFWQIWNMSFGFLGVQFAFGLQQANMSPIYRYLHAEESQIPWLWLAGPITGLLVQPIVGTLSDNTWSPRWGRRKPYLIIGAILTSIALVLMPYSSELWMAAGLLWMLDGAANLTMEPFRALIGDKLNEEQQPLGFSVQSFFVGLGQTLANLAPLIFTAIGVSTLVLTGDHTVPDFVKYSFILGAFTILFAVGYTVLTTKENPPVPGEEPKKLRIGMVFTETFHSIRHMPSTMKKLWWVKFFTWVGLPIMWQYLSIAIAHDCFHTTDPNSPAFAEGVKWGNLGLAIFNILCFAFAMVIPRLIKRMGTQKTHGIALFIGGAAFMSMRYLSTPEAYMLAMAFVGISWASIMSVPYVMLSKSVPAEKMGVYMGVFNMFIVIPQIVSMIVLPMIYKPVLGNSPSNALFFAGTMLFMGGIVSWRLRLKD
ncbi:MAG: hypothetical protein RLZZ91_318 [Bacteroidota bacterium]|jgi:maltose/moltooligosaccharide transporter